MNLNKYDEDFWQAIDELVSGAELVIDRPKGSHHPRYPEIEYMVDYGYLNNTASMDGGGIDIWRGTSESQTVDAIICTVDLKKKDSEIKILIGCTEKEKDIIYNFHNDNQYMKGIMIRRNQ